ncbi:MAG: putative metal-dependent hydrolase [Candidatus Acidiferrales bacterium]
MFSKNRFDWPENVAVELVSRYDDLGNANCTRTEIMTEDLRYPIGKFHAPASISEADRAKLIDDIEAAPALMRAAVAGLSPEQLRTPYRDGGWTVLQLVHHVPDSHMNAYVRFKLALTEDEPTIKPYEQARWAELADSEKTPAETSLALLDSLHKRWVTLLRSLSPADWSRNFRHPELGVIALDRNLALYAWHGKHHVAHITSLRERKGWK